MGFKVQWCENSDYIKQISSPQLRVIIKKRDCLILSSRSHAWLQNPQLNSSCSEVNVNFCWRLQQEQDFVLLFFLAQTQHSVETCEALCWVQVFLAKRSLVNAACASRCWLQTDSAASAAVLQVLSHSPGAGRALSSSLKEVEKHFQGKWYDIYIDIYSH